MPSQLAHSLTLAEEGAFIRLASAAWREEPPCSLPDDSTFLAGVVGITVDKWPRLSRLAGAFTLGTDGRLHLPLLRALYDRLATQADSARRRTQAATAAAAAKRRGGVVGESVTEHPSRIVRNGSVTDPLRMAAPSEEARAREERSALQRSSPEINSQRSLSAQSTDVIARIGSAGARALTEEKIHAWRRSQALSQLRSFVESLRAGGLSNVPLSKADELAGGPWSSPERVDAAICRVKDRMAVKDCHKPVGYLIAMLGLSAKGRASLVEVPLVIAAKWEQQEAAVARQLAVVAATAAALEERRFQVSQSGSQSQSGAGFPRANSGA